ncbi:MAG: CDP-glycerol glycerophosphotransferase family protein, partial [Candidatus Limnocylindrales bacterium]
MSHPGAAHADGVRRIEILSITWERIQITIRLRPLDGRPFDPDGIRLRHAERGTLATPTRARREGDVVVIRCNVMQGPGQRPLDPGTWAVVSVVGTLVATLMVAGTFPDAADDAQGDLDAGTFDLDAGRYLVRPRISPDAALALEVVMEASNPKGSLPARVIERIRRTRLVAFSALLLLLRAAARRNGRRILFTSDSRASLGGNLQQVHARMVERGLDRHYELLTLFKPSITVRRGLRDRLRLPWLLARADTIVIDDYQPVISRLDARHSRIVQLWHAWGAFKTVGYSRVGKP